MRADAFEFFSAREHEIEQHLSREGRRFLADASGRHPRPFWDERSEEDAGGLDEVEAVHRAFERLKGQDDWRPRKGPAIAIEPRPIVRGNAIVLEPHLVSSNDPRGVRYVRGIDLVAVTELAPESRSVPDLFETYVERLGSAPLHDFLFALATAVARGWLVSE
jgi:hypothetical protein